MNPILQKNYLNIPVNIKEFLRYAKAPDVESFPDFEKCLKEAGEAVNFKVCYRYTDVSVLEDEITFDFGTVKSKDLAKNLSGVNRGVIFAATCGQRYDFLIEKYSRLSPVKGLLFQALGAERVESLCDEFCDDLKRESGRMQKPRFSPGYGDLDLSFQRQVFDFLDCQKRIGLTLNDSLIMAPSKSVTAIVGFTDEEYKEEHNCSLCPNLDCEYRNEG